MLLLGRCALLSALAWGAAAPPRSGPKARRSKGRRDGARRLEDTTVPTSTPTSHPTPTFQPTPVPTSVPTVPATAPTSVPTALPTPVPTFQTVERAERDADVRPDARADIHADGPCPRPCRRAASSTQFSATGEVESTTCNGGRSPWDYSTMTDLCTAGYSEYGAAAPPFRDCRQEAVDSGNCGTYEMCVECENWWDWAEGKYWANVGYEACPDWVVDAINAEGATGGQWRGLGPRRRVRRQYRVR